MSFVKASTPKTGFGSKYLNKRKKTSTTELVVNRQHIVDQVSAFLYATSAINDNLDVTGIDFGDLAKELVTIKVHTKEVPKSKR